MVYQETSYDYVLNFFFKNQLGDCEEKNCESTDVIMFQFDIREMTLKKTLLHHFL